jgi:hypothetical protein
MWALDGHLLVFNLFDKSYELRDGTGIGVGAPNSDRGGRTTYPEQSALTRQRHTRGAGASRPNARSNSGANVNSYVAKRRALQRQRRRERWQMLLVLGVLSASLHDLI